MFAYFTTCKQAIFTTALNDAILLRIAFIKDVIAFIINVINFTSINNIN